MDAVVSPQPLAVGEPPIKPTYAQQIATKIDPIPRTTPKLKPVQFIHGEPTVMFSLEERQQFAVKEGLHQSVVMKVSPGAPELNEQRDLLPKHLGVKGRCIIGLLAPRQLLLRFDRYDDYVSALARSVNYLLYKGVQLQYRVFPWTIGYNPKEETTKAVVWISLPNLSPDLFVMPSLLSIASAVGKPIAIDKATQTKSRPSTARVKVILDLLNKHPNRVRLQSVDAISGKVLEVFQEIVYDNLPLYCNCCKHQGHDETTYRRLQKKNRDEDAQIDEEQPRQEQIGGAKYKGDLHQFLNERRALNDGDRTAGDHINHTNATKVLRAPQRAHEHAENLIKTAHVTAVSTAALVPVDTALANASHHEAVAGQSNLRPVSKDAISDRNSMGKDNVDKGAGENEEKLLSLASMANGTVGEGSMAREGVVEQHDLVTATGMMATTASKTIGDRVVALFEPAEKSAVVGEQFATTTKFESVVQAVSFEAAGDIELGVEGFGQSPNDQRKSKDKQVTKVTSHHSNANRNGQELEKGDGVTGIRGKRDTGEVGGISANNNSTNMLEAGSQHGQQSPAKGWSVVHRSPSRKGYSDHKNLEATTEFKVSNSFDALVCAHEHGNQDLQHKELNADLKIMQQRSLASTKNQQNSGFPLDIVPVARELKGNHAHSSNAPALQFSSPQVEKIIKHAQNEMMLNTNMVKQPWVTLNTSVFEVPSQSLDSCGEHGGDQGQLVLSTGNNNELTKENVRAMAIKSKLWDDQPKYDDEEDLGVDFAEDFSDESERSSGDDEMLSVGSPSFPNIGSSSKLGSGNKLDPKAPDFIPKSRQQQKTNGTRLQEFTAANPPGQQQTMSSSTTGTLPVINQTGQQQQQLNATAEQQIQFAQELQQIVITTPTISLEDRKLLDALVISKPLNLLTPSQVCSTGQPSKVRNNVQRVQQHQDKTVITKAQDANVLMTQNTTQNLPNTVNFGRDIYEEGEEDEMLQECRAHAVKQGDLSPMHSGNGKKTHTRKNSWDDKVSDFLNVRRPPMRVAKQKRAAPTTSTRSNRSKKK